MVLSAGSPPVSGHRPGPEEEHLHHVFRGERMFNIRPDQLWPWIRFEPPSEDPPGFRIAADGSIRATGESGSGFPGYGSGTNTSAPFDIEFGNAYRAASSSFDGQRNGAGLIPSFGSGSLPPFATS